MSAKQRLRDFAPEVFARELADPGATLLPSPSWLRHLFEVLEEEIAKVVAAQVGVVAAAPPAAPPAPAAPIVVPPEPAAPVVDPSTGESLGEIEHPTPQG